MKKNLVCLLLFVLSVNVSAQHMEFNGVEMTGAANEFVSKLKAKGWIDFYEKEAANDPRLTTIKKDSWASFKDVVACVCTTPKSKIVYAVVLDIPVNNFNVSFEYLKQSLLSKYGEPISDEGNGIIFGSGNPRIGFLVLNKLPSGNSITCTYFDLEGYSINKSETQSDL